MSKQEFIDYFHNFFQPISGTIDLNLLPDALTFLVSNTGILIIQDDKYVKFLHESYMEYYASREIFAYKRQEHEADLVQNFLESSWQYVAIFYAGRSKQMDILLTKIIERCKQIYKAPELVKSVHGLGYLSQALYMTDDNIRKEAIKQSLSNILEVYEWMKKMAADDKFFFKNLNMPITIAINSMIFFDHHNSITLKRPLELCFDELLPKLEVVHNQKTIVDLNIGFKLFTIALTLSSPRLGNSRPMEKLLFETPLMNEPLFETILDFGSSLAGSKELYQLKEGLKKPLLKSSTKLGIADFNKKGHNLYVTAPLGRYRFTHYDKIYPDRKFNILTEGKTDAQIIEHAYTILTDQIPYWDINPVNETAGGANRLAKCLESAAPLFDDRTVLGIFDNDEAGISQFKGTLKSFDIYANSKRIKKHTTLNIFALKLPIPPHRENYYMPDDRFNFFSLEHYFSDNLLQSHNMFQKTPIDNIFQIKDKGSSKTEFSKYVRTLSDREIFKDFIYLFREIDEIFGNKSIEYLI